MFFLELQKGDAWLRLRKTGKCGVFSSALRFIATRGCQWHSKEIHKRPTAVDVVGQLSEEMDQLEVISFENTSRAVNTARSRKYLICLDPFDADNRCCSLLLRIWDCYADGDTSQFVKCNDTVSPYSVLHGHGLLSEAFAHRAWTV